MIRLQNLRKAFRGRPALHDLSLQVERGEIFGLLGHNGAGKSTAFGILLGQVYPDSGEAFLGGISVQRDRARALARTGAIFESPAFYDYLSGWRNLEILTSYSGFVPRSEIAEAVQIVGLTARIHDPVRAYSHGMRQRLALAQTLLPAPDVIILDEPTEGLDAQGIAEMRELILRLNRERGLTVLLASHLLSEVEQLCSRVAILSAGRLVFEGRWADLDTQVPRFHIDVSDWPLAAEVLTKAGARVLREGVFTLPEGGDVADVASAVIHAGLRLRSLERHRPSLESLYLERIGPAAAEAAKATVHGAAA